MAGVRPQAGGSTGLKAALIAFVVLTVAAVTFTIILYTDHEDLTARADGALKQADNARRDAAKDKESLIALAKDVVGKDTDDQATIKEDIKSAKQEVLEELGVQEPNTDSGSPLVDLLKQLISEFSKTSTALAEAKSQRDDLQKQYDVLDKQRQEWEGKDLPAKRKELEDKYTKLEQQHGADIAERDKLVSQLEEKLKSAADQAGQDLAKAREDTEKLAAELTQEKKRSGELLAQLTAFKPSAEEGSILQVADGAIVRVVIGEDVVYIGLGRQDGVKPGMTFSVYSRKGGIPVNGKGKATIRVSNLFETTAECRVTNSTKGEPIIEGDLIANPVYDRTRQFHFVVAGDFDLDFDGRIDDPGGQQVARLVERWGGKVVSTADTSTDFVVLGAAPPLPLGTPAETANDAEKERAKELETNRKAFDRIKADAQALSIPILTRTRFLHFLGYGVPAQVPDDKPAL